MFVCWTIDVWISHIRHVATVLYFLSKHWSYGVDERKGNLTEGEGVRSGKPVVITTDKSMPPYIAISGYPKQPMM